MLLVLNFRFIDSHGFFNKEDTEPAKEQYQEEANNQISEFSKEDDKQEESHMLMNRSAIIIERDEDYEERYEMSHDDLHDPSKNFRDKDDKETFNEKERDINQSKLDEPLSSLINTNCKTFLIKVLLYICSFMNS